MLDADAQLDLPESLGLIAYLDTDDIGLVHVIPMRPSIARTPDGTPAVSLSVYRRKQDQVAFGGQLSITLVLRTDEEALQRLVALVDHSRPPALPGEPAVPPTRISGPDWTDGKVRLQLVDGVAVDGTPSMSSDNTCALAVEIGADRIGAVLDAWEDGLPDAVATYDVTVRSAVSSGLSARLRWEAVSTQYAGLVEQRVSATGTQAGHTSLTITGPIRLTAAERATARTDFTL